MLLLSKYSTEALAQEGECPASWQEGWWIEGEVSILGLAGSGRGFLARVSSLGDFWFGYSPSFLIRSWGVVVHSGDPHAAWSIMSGLPLGRQESRWHRPWVPVCLPSGAGFSALWLASLLKPRFLLEGPGFSGLWVLPTTLVPSGRIIA